MTTVATWRVVPAPKFAGMRTWDCARCDHEDLARPVFLTDGGATIAVGTGCAARLLGVPTREAERVAAVTAIDALDGPDGEITRRLVDVLRVAWKPRRITPKLVRDLAAWAFTSETVASAACDLYAAAYR